MAVSIYMLKPAFIRLLRPLAAGLVARGATANHVTAAACLISCLIGLLLYLFPLSATGWCLLPVWLFVRMALNAVDGIMAREHGQKSRSGALLNEMGDVAADAALVVPFVAAGAGLAAVVAFLWMALLTEFAGVLGLMIGASRRYDGPMGKSDRAFFMGVAALLAAAAAAWGWDVAVWLNAGFWLCSVCMLLSVRNRLRGALKEGASA